MGSSSRSRSPRSRISRRSASTIQRREILDRGLLDRPEDPVARYLREKYPESWALAREERGCP